MRLSALLHTVLDLALPPRCPACGAIVAGTDRFCVDCWRSLRFLGPPWCATCQRPFETDRGAGAQCAACLAVPPRHDGVRAAVAYGTVSRTIALRLKYNRRTAFAATMARLMARHLPADATLLLPVPLHRWRIWTRGYNQAALIAAHLARAGGVPHRVDILVRTRGTPILRGRSAAERRRAVKGAFAVRDAAAVTGQRMVLVDDIYTSGATTDACIAVLRAAGAASVTVLAWARVLDEADETD
ncbi:double zinc ribbon domain-containing protein [Sphingomonas adhaesiva]|uniref:double zinc ribbon domain-containing protein n=1 Tax=Sphingomonas adhaesiva TaxID=28212 RepID=UPI003FA79BEE